jgi:hypothetical protein
VAVNIDLDGDMPDVRPRVASVAAEVRDVAISPAGIRAAVGAGMTAIQVPDLVHPDEELRALGHRIVGSLLDARALLMPLLPPP